MVDVSASAVGLVFRTGHAVLQDVDFHVPAGAFVSLVGPSGCGKSTLLRMIAGLLAPTSGRLLVAGVSPPEARPRTPRTSFVFQDPNLLPWRTVADNIRLPLELARVPRARQDELLHHSLRLINLTDSDARKRPHMLSGGMKMRVSLARALVTEPDLLLLDEPFAALDDLLRQQLNEELFRIWRERQWTAVFVTHNVAEAVFLSQELFVLGRSPATIVARIGVPFGAVRSAELRAEPAFARLCGQVSRALREAAA